MFSGRYPHNIDSKGRTSFPSRFRDVLSELGDDKIVLTNHLNDQLPCLEAWPLSRWKAILSKATKLPRMAEYTQYLMRWYISSALECQVDQQGRILVPPYYREHAKLTKEVLWSGVTDHLELWSKDMWERHIASLRESRSFDLGMLNSVFELEQTRKEEQ
ncbi:MAG: division/cell wall cluster transcriptional repressor MraZ [Deltaproteobacteria bacterium]|nr:division/cell wall cluster transcriptional repressor MraZ [Deltaproteobacteria bacterium]